MAQKYNAVNLGQGFPNYDGPTFILDAAKKALDSGLNQYTRSQGHVRLVNALANFYSPKFERKINPLTEILTTVGASEALFATISALVNPGDEVILVEPFFDIYYGAVEMSGAVPKYLPMKREATSSQGGIASSAEWKIDPKDLEKVLTDRSKLLILNTPHNPTGKVLKRDELEAIAEVVKKHPQLIVISDEVYEFMTYDGVEHERIAKVPGMWERTVTISSAGKTFSSTGWKVGWCVGPDNLISAISVVHSYIPFSIATPLQEAVAVGFEEAESRKYFAEFQANYLKRRDKLVSALVDAGLNPMIPEGSFFVLADASTIKPKDADGKDVDLIELAKNVSITGTQLDVPDYNLGRWFTTQVGVAVIPVSAFVSESHQSWYPYIRFCFCKTDDVLDEACKRLRALKK